MSSPAPPPPGLVRVASRKKNPSKAQRSLPFTVSIEPGGPPVTVEGAFEQKAKGGSILVLVAILIVVGALVFLLKDQAGALAF